MTSTKPANPTLSLPCPAKVNLALAVGAPGSSGYHPLASWVLAIDLADTLTLERVDRAGENWLTVETAADAPAPMAIDWPVEQDLAWRAHALLARETGVSLPVRARLAKRVPAGMGLAGGSSDAAAMLVGLDRLFDLQLGQPGLMRLAPELGSDVALFVHVLTGGSPSLLMTGTGETIEPAPLAAAPALVLVMPALHCDTGAVYRAFDATQRDRQRVAVDHVREMAQRGKVTDASLFNDLASPAFAVTPELREQRERLERCAEMPVHVTGSGAGLFMVASSPEAAARLAGRVTRELGLPAAAVRQFEAFEDWTRR